METSKEATLNIFSQEEIRVDQSPKYMGEDLDDTGGIATEYMGTMADRRDMGTLGRKQAMAGNS
jgi:hypothetical protein